MQTSSPATCDRTIRATVSCGPASQIFRDQPEVPKRSLAFRAGSLERPLEAMADVIVYQRLLRILDRALHGLQLVCNLGAGLPCSIIAIIVSRWPLARFRRRAIGEWGGPALQSPILRGG